MDRIVPANEDENKEDAKLEFADEDIADTAEEKGKRRHSKRSATNQFK